MDTVLSTLVTPLRPLHSPGAQRAYITTFLLSISSSFLLFVATISYILFYINYIPNITISKDIYLTYPPPPPSIGNIPYSHAGGVVLSLTPDAHATALEFPSGTVDLHQGDLIPNQNYDVEVEMHLPTSPANRDLGNFMVVIELWSSPVAVPAAPAPAAGAPPPLQLPPQPHLLHTGLRPAILTYHSQIPSLLSTILRTPLLLTSLTKESESLTVPLLSKVSFPSRTQTPASVKVTLRAPRIQTYTLRVRFKARLGGLRNIMYTYRLAAAMSFISGFWVIEMICAVAVWWVLIASRTTGPLGIPMPPGSPAAAAVKLEELDEEESPLLEQLPRALGPRPRTPGAGVTAGPSGRGYLPSPSPTPQPALVESIFPREGYADAEETETDVSTIDGGEEDLTTRAGAGVRGVRVESETEEDEGGSEEEAVMVRGSGAGGGGVTDSGIGSSVYESAGTATGREGRRGSSGSGGGGGPIRRR